MTAITCREKFDKRQSKVSVSIEPGASGYRVKQVRTHTRHFEVTTDGKWDDGYIAMQHPSLPRCFDFHPNDPFAYCKDITPSQFAGAHVWEIVCNYSSEVPDSADESEDPLSRPVRRWLEFNEIKVPFYKDINGKPVTNSAGVPFNPPIEIPGRTVVFCFERNEPSFSVAYGLSVLNHVNEYTISGIQPGYLFCNHLAPEEKSEKGKKYVQVQYKFEYNPLGWQPRPMSRGVFERDAATGKLVRIKDKSGKDVTEPVPLDADGKALTPDDVLNNPSSVVYMEADAFEPCDFQAVTNLPFWT